MGTHPRLPRAASTGIVLEPDSSRVIARMFVPGLEEVGPTGSRASAVIDRLLALDEQACIDALEDVMDRFSTRHRNLEERFRHHAEAVLTMIDPDLEMSEARRTLIGACFTHEYSVEAAALCNPSIVLQHHVEETDGSARFIMSVRGIGEGHRSSIGFRTGRVSANGEVTIHEPSPYAIAVPGTPGVHHRSVLHAKLDSLGDDFTEVARFVSTLPPTFDDAELSQAVAAVAGDPTLQRMNPSLLAHVTALSRWSYRTEFPEDTHISERILWPNAPPEYHGMEDARFVRFEAEDGEVLYYGTYTAFDRGQISLQLLETTDFRRFSSSPIAGAAAEGKGLAIFPRKVGGRYWALTRSDRETNGIASSDDLRHWPSTQPLQPPRESWEILQLGNCGSPIEIDEGWLVLTHGVGPMRTYSLGALLLDKDDPTTVLRRATEPIVTPDTALQDGYVPNVVYSCGGIVHRGTLVLPFGIGDQRISVVTMSVAELVDVMDPA